MRVIIDAISIDSGGGRAHFNGLIPALVAGCENWHFLVLVRKGVANIGRSERKIVLIELPIVLCKFPFRVVVQQCAFPLVAWVVRAQAVLSLSDVGPIWLPVPVLAVVTNALIYRAFARFGEPGLTKSELPLWDRIRTRSLAIMSKIFLPRTDGLIFQTAASRAEVETLTGEKFRSAVIHNGEPFYSETCDQVLELRRKQIICVSSIVRYRNQLQLVQAFHELLKSDARCKEYSLILIGEICDRQYIWSIRDFVEGEKLQNVVRILGNLSYDQVLHYYRASWGMVFPSRVETYGFPIVECLFSSTPMAVSDIPPFRELAGSAAIYFDPNSVGSIRDGLAELLWNDVLRQKLVEAQKKQRSQYSWKLTARQTAKLIEEVINVHNLEGKL